LTIRPQCCQIVNMLPPDDPIRALCGSEARFRLVKALYEAPETAFHLRGLAAAARVDPSQAHRLVREFVAACLCEELAEAPFKKYRAAVGHPLTDALVATFATTSKEDDKDEVDLAKAPVLRSLLWTGRERARIPAREAFRHYENNWRQVRSAPMGAGEKKLLERLARDYGRGLING
jgi:hypothetical protein